MVKHFALAQISILKKKWFLICFANQLFIITGRQAYFATRETTTNKMISRIMKGAQDSEPTSAHEIFKKEAYGQFISDLSILHQWVLFLESENGLNATDKNGTFHSVNVTGLSICSSYWSIHTMQGKFFERRK